MLRGRAERWTAASFDNNDLEMNYEVDALAAREARPGIAWASAVSWSSAVLRRAAGGSCLRA